MNEIVSISVIGPNVFEADRFATAAFAMQRKGINFIEKLDGFEAYMIDKNGIATMTSKFEKYIQMLKFIDNFLNKTTMYRLVLYCLIFLVVVALVFSFLGKLLLSR